MHNPPCRFSGAACGTTIIFALPVLVHLVYSRRAGELTWTSLLLHAVIMALGTLNLIAQFLI